MRSQSQIGQIWTRADRCCDRLKSVVLALISFVLLFSHQTLAGFESFDWLRGRVNEAWYDTIIGECNSNTASPTARSQANYDRFLCERQYDLKTIEKDSAEFKEQLFFNTLVEEQARQNSCQYDLLRSMSLDPLNGGNDWKKSQDALKKDHPWLKDKIDPTLEWKRDQALAAQTAIVKDMTEKGIKLRAKRQELSRYLQNTDLGKGESISSYSDPEAAAKIESEIKVIQDSVSFTESEEGRYFFNVIVMGQITRNTYSGKEPDSNVIMQTLLSRDSKYSFQKNVIEKQLENLKDDQKTLADTHGNYKDQYALKRQMFKDGKAYGLLFTMGEFDSSYPDFSSIYCSTEKKYGLGGDVGALSNSLVFAAATAGVGGSIMAVEKMGEMGIIAAQTARVIKTTTAYTATGLSASEVAVGVLENCGQSQLKEVRSGMCAQKNLVQKEGAKKVFEENTEKTMCVMNAGLALINGKTAFNQFKAARAAKLEQNIVDSGLQSQYKSAADRIEANPRLTSAKKAELKSELDRAFRSKSSLEKPRAQFLDALSEEDPDTMRTMLREINGRSEATWGEKVRNWLKSKKLIKSEEDQLSSCLIENSGKSQLIDLSECRG